MKHYYNEFDPNNVLILKQLISDGLIPDGDVDDRSITEVQTHDLDGYAQCHFFAGIGGWAYAALLAGWGDRPLWTGSCPCQPFAAPGAQKGFGDERHLWPEFYRLIKHHRPPTVVGEQVASPLGLQWLDTVFTDLEDAGYTTGAADLCAASVGAPHIRQRLYFVGLGDAELQRLEGHTGDVPVTGTWANAPRSDTTASSGPWAEFDVWESRSTNIRRPLQPGCSPLAPRLPTHMVECHAYGNAIVPQLGAEFLKCFLKSTPVPGSTSIS